MREVHDHLDERSSSKSCLIAATPFAVSDHDCRQISSETHAIVAATNGNGPRNQNAAATVK